MNDADGTCRSSTLSSFTDTPQDIAQAAKGLLRALNVPHERVRGIGLTVRPACPSIGFWLQLCFHGVMLDTSRCGQHLTGTSAVQASKRSGSSLCSRSPT